MDIMTAYCGLLCHKCPAFIATEKDDDNERKKVAEEWSKHYKSDIKPEHINCLGCTSEKEPIFQYCRVCKIRKCAREKGLENCAYCDHYACEKLNEFFKMVPEAMVTLENIRMNL
jgi:hypothetical protein